MTIRQIESLLVRSILRRKRAGFTITQSLYFSSAAKMCCAIGSVTGGIRGWDHAEMVAKKTGRELYEIKAIEAGFGAWKDEPTRTIYSKFKSMMALGRRLRKRFLSDGLRRST